MPSWAYEIIIHLYDLYPVERTRESSHEALSYHPRHVVTLPWHAGNNGRGPRTRRAVLRRASLPPHAQSRLKLTLSKRSTMKTSLAFLPRLNSLRPSPRSKKRR